MIKFKTMITAHQVAPELQQSPLQYYYFELNNSDDDNIVITGNNDLLSFTSKYNESIYIDIDNLAYNAATLKEYFKSINEFINYYALEKKNGRSYTPAEKHKLITTLTGYYNGDIDILECYNNILSIVYSARFDYKQITGSVQGEYNYCFYNTDIYSPADIDIFESDYFNTGSEWYIGDNYYYCHGYNAEMIKNEIGAAFGIAANLIKLDSVYF